MGSFLVSLVLDNNKYNHGFSQYSGSKIQL